MQYICGKVGLLQTHVWRFLLLLHNSTLQPGGVQEEADDPVPAWQCFATIRKAALGSAGTDFFSGGPAKAISV